jgi:hypothetical protein
MKAVLSFVAAFALAGCLLTSKAGAGGGDKDGGPACVLEGDSYACPGGMEPACSAAPGDSCDYRVAYCLTCSDGGGVGCSCQDAEDAGLDAAQAGGQWVCLDNGVVCR